MKIAVPTADGHLAMHFGQCDEFTLFEVDHRRKVVASERVPAPEHVPGLLPEWLRARGATAVIAGGMGIRAQRLFAQSGITVLTGAPAHAPQSIVQEYLDGKLELGENVCDH